MRRSRLFRLPAPIFLIVCVVWLAWSIVSLVCRIVIWVLMHGIRACQRLSQRFPLREPERVSVCITRATAAPPRKPALVVMPNAKDTQKDDTTKLTPIRSKTDAEYMERRKRLMAALGIKHEDIADELMAKGYPVGW